MTKLLNHYSFLGSRLGSAYFCANMPKASRNGKLTKSSLFAIFNNLVSVQVNNIFYTLLSLLLNFKKKFLHAAPYKNFFL